MSIVWTCEDDTLAAAQHAITKLLTSKVMIRYSNYTKSKFLAQVKQDAVFLDTAKGHTPAIAGAEATNVLLRIHDVF